MHSFPVSILCTAFLAAFEIFLRQLIFFFCCEKKKENSDFVAYFVLGMRHLHPTLECAGGLTVDNCIVSSTNDGCDDVLINEASDG